MTERLARFTPASGALDRDALLFAAGRQSARPSRLWPVVAGLLAVAQAGTLVALWPRESPAPVATPPAPPAAPPTESLFPPASPEPRLWSAGSRPDVLLDSRAAAQGEFVSSEPPLTAGSIRRFD